jgi:hypothetical protein
MTSSELGAFLAGWTTDEKGMKPLFLRIHKFLEKLPGVSLEYKGRPGVSHSVRARHADQKERPLFALVDIIDDDPDARWLSVCLYADLVSDPDGRGDMVPGGLTGDDACCFDIDSPGDMEKYVLARLKEAAKKAARS